jgi:magnesium chelatase subunit D
MSVPSLALRASSRKQVYPFAALVGQERLKLALLLTAVSPEVGGVLLRGEKGTGKSTAVRALAAIMPEIECFEGCEYACDPTAPDSWCPSCREGKHPRRISQRPARVVTLPLGATEDMVCGSLDLSRALRDGGFAVRPGLLARANRGVLYVDEANLLDDRLVNVVLDAAATGENCLEREGLSLRHRACFCLVGTMNPEEGPLRPQFLDRFGLCVEIGAERDPGTRVELMERRERFERDPEAFAGEYLSTQKELAERLARARKLTAVARLEAGIRNFIAELALQSHAAGHRAELALARAALAHCAWYGRTKATNKDVLAVAEMVLAHRRRDPLPPEALSQQRDGGTLGDANDQKPSEETGDTGSEKPDQPQERLSGAATDAPGERGQQDDRDVGSQAQNDSGEANDGDPQGDKGAPRPSEDRTHDVGPVFNVKTLRPLEDGLVRKGSGRRMGTLTDKRHGHIVGYRPSSHCFDLAFAATIRAAAPHQINRSGSSGLAVDIRPQDWRRNIRRKRVGGLIALLVDASGSMGARGRMAASKGAVMSLLLDAYQKRDRVAMLTFRRDEAAVALPPTASIETASKLLAELPVGGRTPLSAALLAGFDLFQREFIREPSLRPLAVLITDGKATSPLWPGADAIEEALSLAGQVGQDTRIRWIVIDTEEPGIVRFQLAEPLASALGGVCFRIDDLRANDIVNILKGYDQ